MQKNNKLQSSVLANNLINTPTDVWSGQLNAWFTHQLPQTLQVLDAGELAEQSP